MEFLKRFFRSVPTGPLRSDVAKLLSPEQIAQYDEDGVVFPVDVLTPDEAAGYRARLERLEAHHGAMKYSMKPYLTVTLADELAHTPRLLDAVEDLIGNYNSVYAQRYRLPSLRKTLDTVDVVQGVMALASVDIEFQIFSWRKLVGTTDFDTIVFDTVDFDIDTVDSDTVRGAQDVKKTVSVDMGFQITGGGERARDPNNVARKYRRMFLGFQVPRPSGRVSCNDDPVARPVAQSRSLACGCGYIFAQHTVRRP